ncbi:MAG: hypothetical protein IT210_19385, partial [Armatimonadetes bacterium]|nr:hypothetical protein [Armatimonadota bacterium]
FSPCSAKGNRSGSLRLVPPGKAAALQDSLDAVPPPWTPIVLGNQSVSCWNRVYDFGDSLLPARIQSGGADLLAGPIRLAVKTDPQPEHAWSGVDQEWRNLRYTVTQAGPDIVRMTTAAESALLKAECRYRFEFDGMLLCDLILVPKAGSALARRIDLILPFASEQARLYHHNPIKPIAQYDLLRDPFNSGAIPVEGLFLPFTHALWIGNERRGLQWFAESDRGLSPLGYFFSLNRERTLTLSLTGLRRLSRKAPFRFVFGLMASPVKPMPPTDAIRWSWQIIGDESLKPDSPDPLPRLRQNRAAGINATFAVNLTELARRGRVDPAFRGAWQRLNRAAGAAGILLQASMSWVTLEPGQRFTPEGISPAWLMQPELAMPMEEGLIHYPCVGSPFRHWLVRAAGESVRNLGLRGLYLDGPGVAVLCANRAHGCGYEDERGIHPTLPILAARDLMKRLYRICRASPDPGLIVAHMSGFMQLPSLSFADATLGTEHIADWVPDQDARYTLAGFRAEVLGHPYGLPSLWLYTNQERPSLYNALCLLHDLIPAHYDGTTTAFVEAYRAFGAREARWVGYWEAQRPVDAESKDLHVSSYVKLGEGTLTAIANLKTYPITSRITCHKPLLGLRAPAITATVAASGASVQRQGEANIVSLAPGGWALLRVAEQPSP